MKHQQVFHTFFYNLYYPEKYLYATDYSFNNFLKYSKTKKYQNEYYDKKSYTQDLEGEYNIWLWNKIRSDFKRTHGMYNATVTDFRGIKHKITWEDGGIVSIYEQRKLYYEYARFPYNKEKQEPYKFFQNFRMPYKDVRVNNPFIEFEEPMDSYENNGLRILLYSKRHDFNVYVPYEDKYQTQEHNGGVLVYEKLLDNYPKPYMCPDGIVYYFNQREPYKKHGEYKDVVTTNNWNDYLNKLIKQKQEIKEKQDKKNVFLYYEIYDAFCRKYGYKYSDGEYQTVVPSSVTVKKKSSDIDFQIKYQDFYNKYYDYITNNKPPSAEFIQATKDLNQSQFEVQITPERTKTTFYVYLDVNAPNNAKEKEVNSVYMAKYSKVNPKPYSVVDTVSKYKTLKKDDVKMILENLQKRLNTSFISEYCNASSIGSTIMSDGEIREIYFIFENQPEKFREYAKVLDEKYKQYYPQNI